MAQPLVSESRRQRYGTLIDRSLDYLLGQQDLASDPPGMLGGNLNAAVFMSAAGLWAYRQPTSRYHGSSLILERTVLALDRRIAERALMARDFFSPTPVLEAVSCLREIAPEIKDRWSQAALEALQEQGRGSLHDEAGHWSDWDTFFALGAALAWKLDGDKSWLELASRHIQILRANAVDRDGFLHWTTPFENWNPTANYEGLMLANLARYVELTSDPEARSLIDRTAEYYLFSVEPSGLTDYTPSIFPKHSTENKKDSYAFAAAAVEFLAARSQDGRYARVAEVMQANLRRMQKNDGSMDMKAWPVAAAPHSPGLQALATLYLRYAAGWCADGPSQDLPDNYIHRHETLHGFKGRHGDFSYSVGCNESSVSLAGAALGMNALVEGVFCMVRERARRLFGQVGPLWREYGCSDQEVMASTAFYHPVLIKVGAGKQPESPWIIRQTYVATNEALIGMLSFEAPADARGETALADIHLGPAGAKLSWGAARIEGSAVVETENPKARSLCTLVPGSWIHYAGLAVHFLDFFGEGAGVRLWDAVKGEMLHRSAADWDTDFQTVIANDAVAELSVTAGKASGGVHCGLLFAIIPCASADSACAQVRSGGVRLLSAQSKGRRQVAFRANGVMHVAVITHEKELKTVPVEIELPTEGPHAVTVHAYLDAPPIRVASFTGKKMRLEVLAVSPVVLVRIAK